MALPQVRCPRIRKERNKLDRATVCERNKLDRATVCEYNEYRLPLTVSFAARASAHGRCIENLSGFNQPPQHRPLLLLIAIMITAAMATSHLQFLINFGI